MAGDDRRIQAVDWVRRLESRSNLTEAELDALHKWLSESRNAEAFRECRDFISRIQELSREEVVSLEKLARQRADRVCLPPGYRLTAFCRFLLPRAVFKRYVAPTIADMQEDYIDALALDHKWHARWIFLRGHLLVVPGWLYAFCAGKLVELLRRGGGN